MSSTEFALIKKFFEFSKDGTVLSKQVLVTGSSGYFGGIITKHLLEAGYEVVGVDRLPNKSGLPIRTISGDIRNENFVNNIFQEVKPGVVVHCAAVLAHERPDPRDLWDSNVTGTKFLAESAIRSGVAQFTFLSTNCLWARDLKKVITEDEPAAPGEAYGASKHAAEMILQKYEAELSISIFRSPTIVSSGRLGLLGLLFQFVDEGRKIPVVGDGQNRYQFIYAEDYANAIKASITENKSGLWNVGSNDIPTVQSMYEDLINHAKSDSKLLHVPERLTRVGLKIAHKLRISPLGPYQYNMLGSDFEFSTSKIFSDLNWKPTKNNSEMIIEAYDSFKYFGGSRASELSAHSQIANGGIISLARKFL